MTPKAGRRAADELLFARPVSGGPLATLFAPGSSTSFGLWGVKPEGVLDGSKTRVDTPKKYFKRYPKRRRQPAEKYALHNWLVYSSATAGSAGFFIII
ncbi:MAG: hypothetical protein IH604_18535 [Burkholderiales bacterium]|nr:hypothetical protein [Burkholderiales bacterium]